MSGSIADKIGYYEVGVLAVFFFFFFFGCLTGGFIPGNNSERTLK